AARCGRDLSRARHGAARPAHGRIAGRDLRAARAQRRHGAASWVEFHRTARGAGRRIMSNVVPLRAPRGRWIPWIFVGCFVVIIPVNAVMVAYALKPSPGLRDQAAYAHGVAYNAVLAEAVRQEALGWRLSARLERQTAGDAVVVRATRADGAPL